MWILRLVSISSQERTSLLAHLKRRLAKVILCRSQFRMEHGSARPRRFLVELLWENNRLLLLARWFVILLVIPVWSAACRLYP